MVNLFETSPSYSFYHCRQFALLCISLSQVSKATLTQLARNGAHFWKCPLWNALNSWLHHTFSLWAPGAHPSVEVAMTSDMIVEMHLTKAEAEAEAGMKTETEAVSAPEVVYQSGKRNCWRNILKSKYFCLSILKFSKQFNQRMLLNFCFLNFNHANYLWNFYRPST